MITIITFVTIVLQMLGIRALYDWQKKVLKAVFDGRSVFVAAPTSSGKSLIYQLPAIMGNGLTIVFSPLRALQVDQVAQLLEKGVKAVLLNSDLSASERRAVLGNLSNVDLLYMAPEQLETPDLRKALGRCHVERIVVDEAHVLSRAVFGFRKAYGKIGEFIAGLPTSSQVIACTATATPKDRKRILKSLGVPAAEVFNMPVRRTNLILQVKKIVGTKARSAHSIMMKSVERELKRWKRSGEQGTAIIYCTTVGDVKRAHKYLKARGWHTKTYTGKTPQKKRAQVQQQFLSGEVPVIIATNAFGLGINKPDVRLIIHAGLPLGMSGYVQEVGRAGRDGKKSRCVLFYTAKDVGRNKNILTRGASRKAARQGLKDLYALEQLLKSDKCMWKEIERYFGERPGHRCKKCCRCKAKAARK